MSELYYFAPRLVQYVNPITADFYCLKMGLYGFLSRGEVARPPWPCFFTDWKSVPPFFTDWKSVPSLGTKFLIVPIK